MHRRRTVGDKREPGAEDRVAKRAVNALPDRQTIRVVVRRQPDRPGPREGDVEWTRTVGAGKNLHVVDRDELDRRLLRARRQRKEGGNGYRNDDDDVATSPHTSTLQRSPVGFNRG